MALVDGLVLGIEIIFRQLDTEVLLFACCFQVPVSQAY